MPNAIYQKEGTSVTWTDTTGDLAITLQNLASGAGRQGETKDWGALSTARATLYKFRLYCKFASFTTVGDPVSFYWKSSDDNTNWDNDDGTGDIALSSIDKLKDLKHIKTLVSDEFVGAIPMSICGYFRNYERYGAPVIYNGAASQSFQNTANVSFLTVTPIYDETQ